MRPYDGFQYEGVYVRVLPEMQVMLFSGPEKWRVSDFLENQAKAKHQELPPGVLENCVYCDGGTTTAEHPGVFLYFDGEIPAVCPYCSRSFGAADIANATQAVPNRIDEPASCVIAAKGN